jgi:hypothetical protein
LRLSLALLFDPVELLERLAVLSVDFAQGTPSTAERGRAAP